MKDTLTIRHYLNRKVKPVVYGDAAFYPLGINVTCNGKAFRIKSRVGEYLKIYTGHVERLTKGDHDLARLFHAGLFSDPWLSLISKEKKFPVFNLMSDEIRALTKVFGLQSLKNRKLTLADIDRLYENCVKEITDVIDEHIKISFLEELKTLFL